MIPTQIFKPFPKQRIFINAALSGKYDFIMYGGGIRSGKSVTGIGTLILLCKIFPGSRWAIVRKDRPVIVKNVYPAWEKLVPSNFILHDRRKNNEDPHVEFINGSKVLFFPENFAQDKDLERFKGLEVNGFLIEEISEIQELTYRKCQERAGSYIIPGKNAKQPYPIVLATCNPSPGWLKEQIYDKHIEGTLDPHILYIHATVRDNIPFLEASPGYIERQKRAMEVFEYERFINGNWDYREKMPNAYWRSFELNKHVVPEFFDPDIPIHVSVDDNALPYIAVSLWQVPIEGVVRQVAEIPAKDPDNTVRRAAKLVIDYLNDKNHNAEVIIHGDATANKKNTIDDEKKSFINIFAGILTDEFYTENKITRKNPGVRARGDFINTIYRGGDPDLKIEICENCKESINDYLVVTQDMNGGMLKKKITVNGLQFEPNGHFSDTKSYILCSLFKERFNLFKSCGNPAEYILKVNPTFNDI